jgi:hypothetical protein
MEILATKERSPRCIGNVAKLDCIFFTQNDVGSRQMNNTGAISGSGPRRGAVTEVTNHLRNKNMLIQAAITQNSQSRCKIAYRNFFFTYDTHWSRKAFSQKSDLELGQLRTGLGRAKIY